MSIELRADAFNVFNHTQFSGVNSTLNFAVLNPSTNQYVNATTSQNGVFGSVINGNFIPVTPNNLTVNANGSTNMIGIMGVGSSPKYIIGRNGTKLDSWDDIKGKLLTVPGVVEADVQVLFDPPWNMSMMSEAAKLQLGML